MATIDLRNVKTADEAERAMKTGLRGIPTPNWIRHEIVKVACAGCGQELLFDEREAPDEDEELLCSACLEGKR